MSSRRPLPVSNFSGNAIPRCYGLMDMQVLEETGAAQVQRSGLDLTGQGVLAAVIDTRCDYTNTVFQLGNQTTKIQYMWDVQDDTGERCINALWIWDRIYKRAD